MKKISLLVLVSMLAVASGAQSSIALKETHVLDTIAKLPEVIERRAYVAQRTNGSRDLRVVIWEKPKNRSGNYWVKVVESNGVADYTHFNFFVNAESGIIGYLDTEKNKMISLQTWRKIKKHI